MRLKRLIYGISILLASCSSHKTDTEKNDPPYVRKCKKEAREFMKYRGYIIKEEGSQKFSQVQHEKLLSCVKRNQKEPEKVGKIVHYGNKSIINPVKALQAKTNLCKDGRSKVIQSSVLFHIPVGGKFIKQYIESAKRDLLLLYAKMSDQEQLKSIYRSTQGSKYDHFYVEEKVLNLSQTESIRLGSFSSSFAGEKNSGFFVYDEGIFHYLPPDALAGQRVNYDRYEAFQHGFTERERDLMTCEMDHRFKTYDDCLTSPQESMFNFSRKWSGYFAGWVAAAVFTIERFEPEVDSKVKSHQRRMCHRGLSLVGKGHKTLFSRAAPMFDGQLSEIVETKSIKPNVVREYALSDPKDWRRFFKKLTTAKRVALVGSNKIKFNVLLDTEKICSSIIDDSDLLYK